MKLCVLWRKAFRTRPTSATLGRKGESLAARFMRERGCRILGRNLQTQAGEADLLCEDLSTNGLILVEVKTRRRDSAARDRHSPEVAVDARKRARLLAIARSLRRSNDWHQRPMRIDIIAIDFIADEPDPQIRHYVSAVQAN